MDRQDQMTNCNIFKVPTGQMASHIVMFALRNSCSTLCQLWNIYILLPIQAVLYVHYICIYVMMIIYFLVFIVIIMIGMGYNDISPEKGFCQIVKALRMICGSESLCTHRRCHLQPLSL